MTDNAELIADVRSIDADWVLDNSPEDSVETIRELAERLEAAEQERDNWKMSAEEAERAEKRWERRAHIAEQERDRLDEAFDRDLPWRYDEVEAQRNQLAAVVEKVLSHDPLHGADSGLHCGGMAPCIRHILATAPADALREHDAALIGDAYGDAEQAAVGALETWWLSETLPEDDTSSVDDVKRAIRAARQRREEQS